MNTNKLRPLSKDLLYTMAQDIYRAAVLDGPQAEEHALNQAAVALLPILVAHLTAEMDWDFAHAVCDDALRAAQITCTTAPVPVLQQTRPEKRT